MSRAQGKFEVEQRRARVAEMYLNGLTQDAIAHSIGVGLATVHRDIKYIQGVWKQSQLETMDQAIVKHLAELDYIRQRLHADYANSKSITTLKELIRVQEREAKLLGLDAPVKQVTNHSPQRIEIVFGDQDVPTDYA